MILCSGIIALPFRYSAITGPFASWAIVGKRHADRGRLQDWTSFIIRNHDDGYRRIECRGNPASEGWTALLGQLHMDLPPHEAHAKLVVATSLTLRRVPDNHDYLDYCSPG